jgi:hypothetical protein
MAVDSVRGLRNSIWKMNRRARRFALPVQASSDVEGGRERGPDEGAQLRPSVGDVASAVVAEAAAVVSSAKVL